MIGMIIAVFLTGISTLQAWNYFRDYPDDDVGTKVLVGVVYVADAAHTAMLVWMMYHYSIELFGDFLGIQKLTPVFPASNAVESIVAFAVQSFYSLRVLRVTRSKMIAISCWIIVISRLAVTEWLVVETFKDHGGHSLVQLGNFVYAPLIASISLAAAADIVIAACLCVAMLRMRSGFPSSNKIVDKLIAFTVGSGLLTSIVALAELITFLTMNNLIFGVFNVITAKVYANSLLASLNERSHLRVDLKKADILSFGRSGMASTHMSFQHVPTIDVRVTQIETSSEDITAHSSSLANSSTTDVEKAKLRI